MGYWNKGLEAGEIKRLTGNELKGEIVIIERRTPKGLYVRGMNNRVIWLHRDEPYKVEDVSKEQLRELGTFRFPFFEKLMVWALSSKIGYGVTNLGYEVGYVKVDGAIKLGTLIVDGEPGIVGVRYAKKVIHTGESTRYRAIEIDEDTAFGIRPAVVITINDQDLTYELLEEIVEGFSIIDIVNEEEEMEWFKEEEQVDFEFEEAEDVTGSEVDSAVDFEIADQPDFEIEGLEEMGNFYAIEEEEDENLELHCAYMEDEIITLRDTVGYLREDGKEKDKEIEKLNKKVKRLQKALRMVLKG